MKLDGVGEFKARVSMAGGAIPIEGAAIIIQGIDSDNSNITHLLFTDNDGLTQTIKLPAPNIDYSLTPDLGYAPFTKYSAEVVLPGFERQYIEVVIFDENVSYQEFNMLPTQ